MGGLIDMEGNWCEWIIHDHECDIWVNMKGWVDVPDSDRGDFRSRRVVDISSCLCIPRGVDGNSLNIQEFCVSGVIDNWLELIDGPILLDSTLNLTKTSICDEHFEWLIV